MKRSFPPYSLWVAASVLTSAMISPLAIPTGTAPITLVVTGPGSTSNPNSSQVPSSGSSNSHFLSIQYIRNIEKWEGLPFVDKVEYPWIVDLIQRQFSSKTLLCLVACSRYEHAPVHKPPKN